MKKVKTKPIKPNYRKIRDDLEEIMYMVAFDCHGDGLDNQIPVVLDTISLLLCTADGNAFKISMSNKDDDNSHYFCQYKVEAIQILKLGIEAYMKKVGMDKASYSSSYGFKRSLDDCVKYLDGIKK